MKKLLILEIAVLAVLVIVSIVVCSGLDRGPYVPALATDPSDSDTTTQVLPPETSQETTQETTEPEPTWMTLPAGRSLTCQQYFVYDCNAGRFLTVSGAENDLIYPASITKLATALVALEYLEPTATVSADNVLDMVVWGSSVADIRLGDTLTVEQLIEGMLLPSGNDAAYVLAAAAGRKIAGDSQLSAASAVSKFMDTMNARARELGMTKSSFVNPDGIHQDTHYMSFADLALLGKLTMENPTILKYANLPLGNNPNYIPPEDGTQSVEGEGAPKPWKNTNELIHPDSQYYCPYAVGLKTGQTPFAGSCLLSAFDYEGQKLIIGVFGCPEKDDRFPDTLQLFNEAIGIS